MIKNNGTKIKQKVVLKSATELNWEDRRHTLAAVDESREGEDALVGVVELTDYDPLNERCAIGIWVRPELRGRGYGKAMVAELVQMVKKIGIHTLYALVGVNNMASRRVFESAGFMMRGRLKDWENLPKCPGFGDAWFFQLVFDR